MLSQFVVVIGLVSASEKWYMRRLMDWAEIAGR